METAFVVYDDNETHSDAYYDEECEPSTSPNFISICTNLDALDNVINVIADRTKEEFKDDEYGEEDYVHQVIIVTDDKKESDIYTKDVFNKSKYTTGRFYIRISTPYTDTRNYRVDQECLNTVIIRDNGGC